MRSSKIGVLGVLAAILAGCSGGGGGLFNDGSRVTGQLSGVVLDVNNNPVRGATVYVEGSHQTLSSSDGSYVLQDVHAASPVVIRASITQDGVNYTGANVADLFDKERSKNANVIVARKDQHARLSGVVTDRNGNPVQGAKIFANGGQLSSIFAVSNADGAFGLDQLVGGLNYKVVASARGFDSDTDSVNVPAGNEQVLNLVLSSPSNAALSPPPNVSATAWTSPSEPTRSRDLAAYEAIKRMIDPRRGRHAARTRDTVGGNHIEVELVWDQVDNPALLGFGIYRGAGASGSETAIDFLRDPLAVVYEDNDSTFHEGQTYNYSVTSLNSEYPDLSGSESVPSNVVTATTLGDLQVLDPVGNTPTFRWQSGSGATSYRVYVFDTYPGIGVSSIWNNQDTPSSGVSATYGGPPLVSGRRYYYVIIGDAFSGASHTISRILSFVAP